MQQKQLDLELSQIKPQKIQLNTQPEIVVYDLRGLRCPLPVLKTDKKMKSLSSNCILEILCDDPFASLDLELLCIQRGYNFNRFNCIESDSHVRIHISKYQSCHFGTVE